MFFERRLENHSKLISPMYSVSNLRCSVLLSGFSPLEPLFLFRMGSFTSSHKILNEDTADNDLDLPKKSHWEDLKVRCEKELSFLPSKIHRSFHKFHHCYEDIKSPDRIRVMQWNILSQALALGSDKFAACPIEALSWHTRRWRILEEIINSKPDVLCLQEVDHYQFFKKVLGSLGYRGTFFPKPDSPCYYIAGNNGPDGCAIFYDESQFRLIQTYTRSLEVWSYQSNQVAILCRFKRKEDNSEFCVATTHLKARQGAILSTMRHEQGKDLLEFIKINNPGKKPVLVTGDFNAGPGEPVYKAMMAKDEGLQLDSAYRHLSNRLQEPPYTTWKIREDGECCQTLDYIFFSKDCFDICGVLTLPTGEDIGEARVPSYRYPSDHFSLIADLQLPLSNSDT